MTSVLNSYTEVSTRSGKLSFTAHNFSDEPMLEIHDPTGKIDFHDCYLNSLNAMQLAQTFDWLNSNECITKYFEHTEVGWSVTNLQENSSDDMHFRILTDVSGVSIGANPKVIYKDILIYDVYFSWFTEKTEDEESDTVHHFKIECTPHEASVIAKVLFNFVFSCPFYSILHTHTSESDKCPTNIVYKTLKPTVSIPHSNTELKLSERIDDVYTIDQERVAEYVNSKIPNSKTSAEDYRTALITSPMYKAIVNKYERRKSIKSLDIITNILKSRTFSRNTIASAFVSKEKVSIPASSVVTHTAIFAAAYMYMYESCNIDNGSLNVNVNLTNIANEAFQTLQLAGIESCDVYASNLRMQENYKTYKEYLIEILTGVPYSNDSFMMMYNIDKYITSDKYYFSLLRMPNYDLSMRQMSALISALCDMYFVLHYANVSFDGKDNYNKTMARLVRSILVNIINNDKNNGTDVYAANIKSTYGIMMTGFVVNTDSSWSIETYARAYGELLAYNAIVSDTPKSELKVGFPVDF